MFDRGYKSVKEEIAENAKRQEEAGKKLFRWMMGKGNTETKVRFLTEEPVTFREHTYQSGSRWDNTICLAQQGKPCEWCDSGNNSSFKGAYLVYDYSKYTDKNGEEKESGLRLYVRGSRDLSQLDRLSNSYGLTNRDYDLFRTGTGMSTVYTFDRNDESDLPSNVIEALEERFGEEYDGSEESLMTIVEDQLRYYLPKQSHPRTPKNANLINLDDEDGEEDEIEPKKSRFKANRRPLEENQAKKLMQKRKRKKD